MPLVQSRISITKQFISIFPFSFQLDVHRFLPFGIMAGLALGAAMLCMTLPETHNQPTLENLSPGPDENKNVQKEEHKDTTVM